ncbi:MAG TPA: hypothetical protein VIR33_18995 [Thermopolyspora sp.]
MIVLTGDDIRGLVVTSAVAAALLVILGIAFGALLFAWTTQPARRGRRRRKSAPPDHKEPQP